MCVLVPQPSYDELEVYLLVYLSVFRLFRSLCEFTGSRTKICYQQNYNFDKCIHVLTAERKVNLLPYVLVVIT